MSWTAPMTAVTGAVLTAAQWNAHVRDNLLETAPAKAAASGALVVTAGPNLITTRTPVQASVATSESTTSTSFTDLFTFGPQVSATTGTHAMVFIATTMAQSTVDMYAICSYEVSGATSIAASSTTSLNFRCGSVNQQLRATATDLVTTLTPGVNVFTLKYQAGGGGTAVFATRTIFVIPL